MPNRKRGFALGVGGSIALILASASLALATETTRAEYTAAVEPICKSNSQANEKILRNVRKEVKQGKLKQAGAAFAKAASALDKTYRELRAVPRPSAEAARLTKWLSYVKSEATLFGTAAKALKADNKSKAQTIVVKLTHNANLANDEVLVFDFHYCKFEPSKFT